MTLPIPTPQSLLADFTSILNTQKRLVRIRFAANSLRHHPDTFVAETLEGEEHLFAPYKYPPGLDAKISRRFAGVASIASTPTLQPSLYRDEVGNRIKFTRLHLGSLALRPASLSFRNSRHSITRTPLLRATKAYGQFLGRDFNPLAKLLLLRTPDPLSDPSTPEADAPYESAMRLCYLAALVREENVGQKIDRSSKEIFGSDFDSRKAGLVKRKNKGEIHASYACA